uniref:Menin n=1 Tax=Macrostomum lignano TaxID=282301 RepID=A0A1I8FLP8_9PLAT
AGYAKILDKLTPRRSQLAPTEEHLEHDFNLLPCYFGSNNCTNFTYGFRGVIDYIFFTADHFNNIGYLDMIPESWFAQNGILGCPHPHISSDHFSLLAELELLPASGSSSNHGNASHVGNHLFAVVKWHRKRRTISFAKLLSSAKDVLALIGCVLRRETEPCLAQLSILLGDIESQLTTAPAAVAALPLQAPMIRIVAFPNLNLDQLDKLCNSFCQDVTCWKIHLPSAAWFPDLLRHVIVQLADRVWARLRPLRRPSGAGALPDSLHSGQLRSPSGQAGHIRVYWRCRTVRLALSEDHAWLVFGHQLEHSAEVSWAGRTLQSLRGQSVQPEHPAGSGAGSSWLYLNGNAVLPLEGLKQRLLWQLYDFGHLKCYPLALINLADLESANPTHRQQQRQPRDELFEDCSFSAPGESVAVSLYNEAIRANLVYYITIVTQALRYWCLAARTVAQYSYSREDAEIYKELFEVSNELVPRLLRLSADTGVSSDARSLAALLHFYDAICLWEQDSNTPRAACWLGR